MYGGTYSLSAVQKKMKKIIFTLILVFSQSVIGNETVNFNCKGLSQFELIGSSGAKEEMKNVTFKFVDGALQDLNNIDCLWTPSSITCESKFLNVRKLVINLDTKEVSDFIAGNKGFGQYIESFQGKCE
jgi:hypothetical protein